jgi:hypothetical protein
MKPIEIVAPAKGNSLIIGNSYVIAWQLNSEVLNVEPEQITIRYRLVGDQHWIVNTVESIESESSKRWQCNCGDVAGFYFDRYANKGDHYGLQIFEAPPNAQVELEITAWRYDAEKKEPFTTVGEDRHVYDLQEKKDADLASPASINFTQPPANTTYPKGSTFILEWEAKNIEFVRIESKDSEEETWNAIEEVYPAMNKDGVGSYTIEQTPTSPSGSLELRVIAIERTAEANTSIQVDKTTSVDDSFSKVHTALYPNPAREGQTISVPVNNLTGSITVRLYDLTGRVVHSQTTDVVNDNTLQLQLNQYAGSGLHRLSVENGVSVESYMLMITK